MAVSTARIVIRHLSGSKINQIEQFDLDGLQEITIGRDPASRIAFDLQRDDEVSRRHAVIRVKNDKELYFRLADLNSSNGTFLNGERIGGEVELLPEDIVELGSGGPKFIFDVQPRPANLPARTRQMGAADAATRILAPAANAGATVEHAAADTRQRTAATDTAALAKVPVGKATIQRMLFDERRKASRVWMASSAVIVLLAALAAARFCGTAIPSIASWNRSSRLRRRMPTRSGRRPTPSLRRKWGSPRIRSKYWAMPPFTSRTNGRSTIKRGDNRCFNAM